MVGLKFGPGQNKYVFPRTLRTINSINQILGINRLIVVRHISSRFWNETRSLKVTYWIWLSASRAWDLRKWTCPTSGQLKFAAMRKETMGMHQIYEIQSNSRRSHNDHKQVSMPSNLLYQPKWYNRKLTFTHVNLLLYALSRLTQGPDL